MHLEEKISLKVKNRVNEQIRSRELRVISDMGYSGYFLIVSDFISWAKKNGLRNLGRFRI